MDKWGDDGEEYGESIGPHFPDEEYMNTKIGPFRDHKLVPIPKIDSFNPDPTERFIQYDNASIEIYAYNGEQHLSDGDDRFYK
jgi:hypothetical protein